MVSSKIKTIVELAVIYGVAFWLGWCSLVLLLFKIIRNGLDVLKVKTRSSPPPILTDDRWGTHQYKSLKKQGIKLHYVEKGDRKNPLLLCLHGFPECWFSWRYQLEEFSSQFWVVAVDMRGYGDSEKPGSMSSYKMKHLMEDIREFIMDTGHTRCSLMAHDWGAVVAWNLVETWPALFKRHISINGPHQRVYREVLRSSFGQFLKSWYVFFFQLPFLPELFISLNDFEALQKLFRRHKNLGHAFPDEVIEAYKYYSSQKGGLRCPINYYRCSATHVAEEHDRKITVPTLIVWGTEDLALSKDIPKSMAKLCVDIQLKMVEGAGHFVHEEEPHHVNTIIWDYIRITN